MTAVWCLGERHCTGKQAGFTPCLVLIKLEPPNTAPCWIPPAGSHDGAADDLRADRPGALEELLTQAQAAANVGAFSTQPAGLQARPQTRAPLSTDEKWLDGHRLPRFSSEVQPLLLGYPLTREEHHKLAKQFRREIIDFLNENNLIKDTSSGGRRWKYHYLGLSLAAQFPNLHWDFRGSRASHGDHSKAKAMFLSKLAEARRHQHARAKSREITGQMEPSS
ncbi:uncharacterized protein [Dermacentor andersoni]|uniref:uncharacterized protein isoform X1 n=1 Tax=Dermacentor andersoni TaxID=34620 RepID=UPI0024165FDA|nr:uncharacterized protein LOC126539397 isoform X1 [Dermacentor andersoni]